ncbi:MAG: hypothetical protein IK136_04835 [Oscillospiraceae bacterium]|nr:hypothetical protein [Oscillospiraceae bacterium]
MHHQKTRKALLIVVGIIAIVLSIVCFAMDKGDYQRSERYGGDAYTGIQNAAARTANNVNTLSKMCGFGFGAILFTGGLTLCVIGATTVVQDEAVLKETAELTTQPDNCVSGQEDNSCEIEDDGTVS